VIVQGTSVGLDVHALSVVAADLQVSTRTLYERIGDRDRLLHAFVLSGTSRTRHG
jgi:hypothetical protein